MEILTTKELAEYLKVKPGTIWSWVSAKSIPHMKLNVGLRGAVRFEKKEIDRWLHSCLRRERRLTNRMTAGATQEGKGPELPTRDKAPRGGGKVGQGHAGPVINHFSPNDTTPRKGIEQDE